MDGPIKETLTSSTTINIYFSVNHNNSRSPRKSMGPGFVVMEMDVRFYLFFKIRVFNVGGNEILHQRDN